MKLIVLLYIVILGIGLLLLYFAVKQYKISENLVENGIKTKAKVIKLIAFSDSDGTTYKPIFEFTDRKLNTVTFKSEISSSPAPYKVGDMVDIIYSMKTNERKVVSYWGLYRWTVILLAIASPFLVIGGGYFLYILK